MVDVGLGTPLELEAALVDFLVGLAERAGLVAGLERLRALTPAYALGGALLELVRLELCLQSQWWGRRKVAEEGGEADRNSLSWLTSSAGSWITAVLMVLPLRQCR